MPQVGERYVFQPRRASEYLCPNCGEEIWHECYEDNAGMIATVAYYVESCRHHASDGRGCDEFMQREGMVSIVLPNRAQYAVPYTWLVPLPSDATPTEPR